MYLGWSVIYLLGMIISMYKEMARKRQWEEYLAHTGLDMAIEAILTTSNNLIVSEVCIVLYSAYIVYIVYSTHIHTIHTIHTMDTTHTMHNIHTIHTKHTTHTIHTIHTIHTV